MEPANDCAFVTLITSDSYVEGAITLAYSIRAVHISTHDTIVLVPPNTLSAAPLARLYRAFHKVVYIPILKSGSAYNDAKHLQLLGRPELDVTYTKIHVFNPDILPGYDRIMFLDADTVLLKNVDVAFNMLDHADFVAAADVGWPDIFNSGVFLARPSKEVYDAIVWDAKYSGSFDGGDQGLLNAFFNTWAGYDHSFYADGPVAGVDGSEPRPYCSPSKKRTARLPFIYNVTPSAVYSYMPAFNQFKKHIAIVHFAGHTKPWNQKRFTDGSVWNSSLTADAADMHGAWWSIYDSLVSRWNVEDQV
ncbi:glycogenin [Obelidium mucronatum]|nr:glycogenin [Obelidium mucronatum]